MGEGIFQPVRAREAGLEKRETVVKDDLTTQNNEAGTGKFVELSSVWFTKDEIRALIDGIVVSYDDIISNLSLPK